MGAEIVVGQELGSAAQRPSAWLNSIAVAEGRAAGSVGSAVAVMVESIESLGTSLGPRTANFQHTL